MVWPAMAVAQPVGPGGNPLGRDQRGQILNQNAAQPERGKPARPANTDGLAPGELYMEADQLVRDRYRRL